MLDTLPWVSSGRSVRLADRPTRWYRAIAPLPGWKPRPRQECRAREARRVWQAGRSRKLPAGSGMKSTAWSPHSLHRLRRTPYSRQTLRHNAPRMRSRSVPIREFTVKNNLLRTRSRLKSLIHRDIARSRLDLIQAVHFRIDLDQGPNRDTVKHYFNRNRSPAGRNGVRFNGVPRLIGGGWGMSDRGAGQRAFLSPQGHASPVSAGRRRLRVEGGRHVPDLPWGS